MSLILNERKNKCVQLCESTFEQLCNEPNLSQFIDVNVLKRDTDVIRQKSEEKLYTIAVCGQVKAGKSMLLNALFFEDEVLPSYATPLTAVLTKLRYTEKETPYCEASFFNCDEWKNYQEDLQEDSSVYDDFCSRLNSRKAVEQRVINQTGKKDQVSLKNLQDYVGKDGEYSLFVKDVTIYLHREELKGLQIVDTPGLGDANRLNSYTTEIWAQKAQAVIYLLKTEGISDLDVSFINTTFGDSQANAHAAPRLLVLGQIDGLDPEEDELWEEVYENLKEKFPNETICAYSSLEVLGTAMKKHHRSMSNSLKNNFENYTETREGFSADPHHLSQALFEKFNAVENGPKEFLRWAFLQVENRFSSLRNHLDNKICETEHQKQTLQKSEEELNAQIDQMNKDASRNRNEIEKSINELRSKISISCQKLENGLGKKLEYYCNSLNNDLNQATSKRSQETKALIRLNVIASDCRDHLNETSHQIQDDLNEAQDAIITKIEDLEQRYDISLKRPTLALSFSEKMRPTITGVQLQITSEELNNETFGFWVTKKNSREKLNQLGAEAITALLSGETDNSCKSILNKMTQTAMGVLNECEACIVGELENNRNKCEEALEARKQGQADPGKYDELIHRAESAREILKNSRRDFEQARDSL